MAESHHNECPRLECPTSGVLLGAFVKAFSLDDPQVGGQHAAKHLGSEPSLGRGAREQFRGGWVDICAKVVEAAIHSGLLEGLRLPPQPNGKPMANEPFLSGLLAHWLDEWDRVYVQGSSGWPHPPLQLGGFVLGRQLVIDLALRVAALLQLMDMRVPAAVIPFAGDERPGRSLIDSLMDRTGRTFTREALADEVGVEKSTVDDWIDKNTVPRQTTIRRLADVFGAGKHDIRALLRYLRVQFGLIALRNRLAESLGARWTRELFAAWACFVQWTLAMHAESKLPRAHFLIGQMDSLVLGARAELNYWVLNTWLKTEEDRGWIDDIDAAQKRGAAHRLQQCFESIGDWPEMTKRWSAIPENAALPEDARIEKQELAPLIWMSPIGFSENFEAASKSSNIRESERLSGPAHIHMGRGEFAEAIPLFRKAIDAEPANADHHCHLGICLWRARPEPQVDQALDELRMACSLRPDWDYPVAEIARVYLHRGWTEHALQHLEQQTEGLVLASQDCSYTMALCLLRLKRWTEARKFAIRARELDPSHADAWSIEAECAFELGDKPAGGKAAREALRLGQAESYNRWVRKNRE